MNLLQKHDIQQLSCTKYLIGVDEAGRGCLAGPVTAGACLLKQSFFESSKALELSSAINDSKQLSHQARLVQFGIIQDLRQQGYLDFEVASASVAEIESFNILGATQLAMQRALEGLAKRSSCWKLPEMIEGEPLFQTSREVAILVDGRPLKPFPYAHSALVGGDGKSLTIAAASIAAKVVRDREMCQLAKQHPKYSFEKHKGYGTKLHRSALSQYGLTKSHRKLFCARFVKPSKQ